MNAWEAFLWDLFAAVGWAMGALFAMLWWEERRWAQRCYAEFVRWKEWGTIIGRHANEMWAELSRRKVPRDPPPLSENLTTVMPQDQLRSRLTGSMPRFRVKDEK